MARKARIPDRKKPRKKTASKKKPRVSQPIYWMDRIKKSASPQKGIDRKIAQLGEMEERFVERQERERKAEWDNKVQMLTQAHREDARCADRLCRAVKELNAALVEASQRDIIVDFHQNELLVGAPGEPRVIAMKHIAKRL
jgi:hypothetical protein